MKMFITIWKYKIKPGKRTEFEVLYGADGAWIELFKKYPGYIKTEFIQDINEDNIYVTVDYWESKEAYYHFKDISKIEFEDIDKKGEYLTIEEIHLGEFTSR